MEKWKHLRIRQTKQGGFMKFKKSELMLNEIFDQGRIWSSILKSKRSKRKCFCMKIHKFVLESENEWKFYLSEYSYIDYKKE